VFGVDRAGHPHRQRLAGVLVDDVEQFQRAAVAGGVELEIQGPDMVGALGSHPLGGHSGLAEPLPLAFPLPHRSNPGRTTLPHVELQRRDGDGGRVVAAACFRRPEQKPSKSKSSRLGTPFGGYKLSGFGGRDNGLEALEQYTELKPFGSPSTERAGATVPP
jgi:hypothetical protein